MSPAPPAADTSSSRSRLLALTAARVAAESRGQDVKILDLREITQVFDYFVIATG